MKDLGVFKLEDGDCVDQMYINIVNGCVIPLFYYNPALDREPDASISVTHKGTFSSGDCAQMYDGIIDGTLAHLVRTNVLQHKDDIWAWI